MQVYQFQDALRDTSINFNTIHPFTSRIVLINGEDLSMAP